MWKRVWAVSLAVAAVALVARAAEVDFGAALRWRCVGPFRGGRTRAAAGVPEKPNLFYMGQVNGGVWRSDDYGRTWTPIFDKQPTQSIGAIAVAPSDANVIYVASGEGLARPDLSVGDGIYRSDDAGLTWTHLGLRDGQQIPAIAVDPRNPKRVFAAVLGHPYGPNEERGIFLSEDGGATWTKTLYVNENTGGSDVQFDPANPDIVYAALWEVRQGPWEFGNEYSGTHGGLFRSTDGGKNWRRLEQGLPEGVEQINFAIAPSDSKRMYAAVAYGRSVGIFRSDDAGATWRQVTKDGRPAERIGGGDLPAPRVDPKNEDVVYSASIVTWRSEDGGATWSAVRGAPGGDDYQNIWINPQHPEIILLAGDQGALVSVNRGRTWSSWYNQPTAQLYHAIATNEFPYKVCGGQQESGSVCVSSRGNDGVVTFRDWHPVGVIEYGYVAPDPLDPTIIYGAGRGQVSKFHTTTGQVEMVAPAVLNDPKYRADRTQPILFSPVNPHTLFYAANVVFQSTDGAKTWEVISPDLSRPHPGVPESLGTMAAKDPHAGDRKGVVYALGPSYRDERTLWAGTDDGLIWLTRDGGGHWKDVTPKGLEAWSKVTQIVASHFDEKTAYASVSRFRVDDLKPYIYRTHDGGQSWDLITEGLPGDGPVNTVREDPERKGLLFAGTENAVWVSFDDGAHWRSLQMNLPRTSVRDLWIQGSDLIAATHGRSFWILDDISPLRQMEPNESEAARLLKPVEAVRVRRDTNTDTPIPPDEALGENPPDGVPIDYYLGAAGAVKIEIIDGAGKVVRTASSADAAGPEEAELAKKIAIPVWWVKRPDVPGGSAGLHRWVWDLHYDTPVALRREYPISAVPERTPAEPLGPRAAPGKYTVRLTANGQVLTAPLEVKMDPRVKAKEEDLRRQTEMEVKLAEMMTASSRAVAEARSAMAQAKGKAGLGDLATKTQGLLGAGGRRFGAAGGGGPTLAGVNGEVGMLYGAVDSADAAPRAVDEDALKKITGEFDRVMKQWAGLKAEFEKNGIHADGAAVVTEEGGGGDIE
jgi:photosystem II stability/assembly factor-like uncharacterized protein